MAQPTDDRPDVVTFLKDQHEEIRRLFQELRAPASDRAELFQCLVRLLAVHETAEEMVVHPQARRSADGSAVVQARLDEEAEAKQTLADLERRGVDDPAFTTELAAFERAVLEHAEREEREELPLLASLDDEASQAMTSLLQVAEDMAPTHPHPHGPESALGNMIVGPFVSVADRVRDTLRR